MRTASFGQIISVFCSFMTVGSPWALFFIWHYSDNSPQIISFLSAHSDWICVVGFDWDHSVMHAWRTGSWSVVNVCFNSLMYHCRNGRRLKKCSKANEVLSLQRILPSKPKRKMKLLDQAQLSRITGLWKFWTRQLREWKLTLNWLLKPKCPCQTSTVFLRGAGSRLFCLVSVYSYW